LGTLGQLHGDLGRQGSGFEQNARRLPVQRAASRGWNTGADGLTCEVVPESELRVALDEQIRIEELVDRTQEIRGRPPERAGQLVEGEGPAEGGGDGHGITRLVGEPAETLAHPLAHPTGTLPVDLLRSTVNDAYLSLLIQPEKRLDHEERASAGFG
jgi:hypothetical protein